MALTFNLELSPRDNREGFRKILIRPTLDRKHLDRIDTNILIEKKHWNQGARFGQWVRKSHPLFRQINAKLEKLLTDRRNAGILPKATKLSDFIDTYLERTAKERSHSYVYNLRLTLTAFAATLRSDINLSEITTQMIVRRKEEFFGRGVSRSSVKTYLKQYHSLFAAALAENLIESNPVEEVKYPTVVKTVRKKLSNNEIGVLEPERIKAKPDAIRENNRPSVAMQQLALKMFLFSYYASGVRIADVFEMRVGNVSGQRIEYEMVKGGGKFKSVPKNKALEALLSEFGVSTRAPEEYLFPVLDNDSPFAYAITFEQKKKLPPELKKLRHDAIKNANKRMNKHLGRAMQALGIQGEITFHISRHSFADKMRRLMKTSGAVTLDAARLALGHGDLRTTQLYFDSLDYEGQDEALSEVWAE